MHTRSAVLEKVNQEAELVNWVSQWLMTAYVCGNTIGAF